MNALEIAPVSRTAKEGTCATGLARERRGYLRWLFEAREVLRALGVQLYREIQRHPSFDWRQRRFQRVIGAPVIRSRSCVPAGPF